MWRQKENIGEGWLRQSLELDELTAQGDKVNNITLFLKKTKFQTLVSLCLYIVKDSLLRGMKAIFSISLFLLYITSNQIISGSTEDILIIFALLETWFQALKYG